MYRVSPHARALIALCLLVSATACSGAKQQQIVSFDGNWRVQDRTSINGLPSYAQPGDYLDGSWLYDTSYTAGSYTELSGYVDSQSMFYGTNGSYNSVWSFESTICNNNGGTVESSGEIGTSYKSTGLLTCDVSMGTFYDYNSDANGYIASSVPDGWSDQSGNVAAPGDAGTLPPADAPLRASAAVSAEESPSDDDVESPGGTTPLLELSTSVLYPDDYIDSPDGTIRLQYQGDCNLVDLDTTTDPWTPLWASNTSGDSAGQTVMQGDGNLVVYDGSSDAVWSSGTAGNDGAYLVLLDTGDMMVLRTDGFALWWSSSGCCAPSPVVASLTSSATAAPEKSTGPDPQASLRRERPLLRRPY